MAVDLIGYLIRVAPATVLVVALYALLRGKQALPVRILIVVIGFLVIRDTLLIYHVWGYGLGHNWLPYVRFADEPVLVAVFAVATLLVTICLVIIEQDGRSLLFWGRLTPKGVGAGVVWGLGGGVVIAGVLAALYQTMPLADRGGTVPADMFWPLVAIAIFGNLTEDVLVRGYFQGYVATVLSPVRAAIASAIFYCIGHLFIALEITNLGVPLLCFALFDGLVCAFVRMKAGLIPAMVAHGMGVAVLAMGLI